MSGAAVAGGGARDQEVVFVRRDGGRRGGPLRHRVGGAEDGVVGGVGFVGGQRQSVAIARAILFNARILIMDEPTASLGPQETQQVGELIKQLKSEGIGIFLISHDIHDVFDLANRLVVMKNGEVVGTARTADVTKDEVLGMIILGKVPPGAVAGPGASRD
jgi:D-xylose transport system ATP-binding protein